MIAKFKRINGFLCVEVQCNGIREYHQVKEWSNIQSGDELKMPGSSKQCNNPEFDRYDVIEGLGFVLAEKETFEPIYCKWSF